MMRSILALALISLGSAVAIAGPLHQASSDGDVAHVRALIDAGEPLDAQGDNGETPLTLALVGGHPDVAALLIERGADVTARNRGGFTPLHAAAYAGIAEIAALLIGQGADVNDQKNKAGVSPLSIASEQGHADVAQVLIEHSANLEAAEQNGYTPLTRAIWRGQSAVVALLQSAGAKCQPVEILEEPAYSDCMAGQQ